MFMQQMKPLKNPIYKLILIILLFAALIISVIIYYNRRIKVINDKLKDTSAISTVRSGQLAVCRKKTETQMTND
jgi:hypothetical protein